MIYYRRYIQDYISATHRLTILEHGAYNVLLDYYYADESPLPPDKEDVYHLARAMSAAEKKAIDKVLARFFVLEDDGYHNTRADHEIEVSKTARSNGTKGGRPPKSETGDITGDITGSETESQCDDETDDGTCDPPGSGQPFSLSTKTSLSTTQPSNLSPIVPARQKRSPAAQVDSAETWAAYAHAYRNRYGIDPVRNAKVNAHISRFIKRVGSTEAPAIAAFYVQHSKSSYVASNHDAKFMELDAEGLRTEWATGSRTTMTKAHQADRTQATGDAFSPLIAEIMARQR